MVGGTVILNVGGSINQVKWETIDKFPKSRLQRLRYAASEGKGGPNFLIPKPLLPDVVDILIMKSVQGQIVKV